MRAQLHHRLVLSSLLGLFCGILGCDRWWPSGSSRQLSATSGQPSIAAATADLSPRLHIGATARRVAIRALPTATAPTIGLLTAGAKLSRSEQPVGNDGCPEGWFAIAPRGYVCLDERTTLDETHPTLLARTLKATLDGPLPYPYAMARSVIPLFEPDPHHQDGVKERGRLSKGSTFAIVGTWDTLDEFDQRQRLAMLTLGSFVPRRDIEPLKYAAALGTDVDATLRFPIGLARSAQIPWYRFNGTRPVSGGSLSPQRPIALTVRSRSFEDERYVLTTSDTYVAERDVVIVNRRLEFPSFVTPSTHWVDVDLGQGLVVLYAGEHPNYVARTRQSPNVLLSRGTTWVKSKSITELTSPTVGNGKRPVAEDEPWLVELENGLTLLAATGEAPADPASATRRLNLAPEDAAKLFRFLAPSMPPEWHAVVADNPRRDGSPVVVR